MPGTPAWNSPEPETVWPFCGQTTFTLGAGAGVGSGAGVGAVGAGAGIGAGAGAGAGVGTAETVPYSGRPFATVIGTDFSLSTFPLKSLATKVMLYGPLPFHVHPLKSTSVSLCG